MRKELQKKVDFAIKLLQQRLNHKISKSRLGWKVERALLRWMHWHSLTLSDWERGFSI